MKKSQKAYEAWQAAVKAARDRANELETKEGGATAEDQTALDDLISAAAAEKKNYERAFELEEQEAVLEETEGRKAKDNRAPALIPEGRTGQTKGLRFSNIWRACKKANGNANRDIYEQVAPEELDISDRLKRAGYFPVHGDSLLMPLDADLLIEPEDEQGRKLADFSALRKEVKERLALDFDRGEVARHVKRSPELAALFGIEHKADMLLGDDTLGGLLIPETRAGRIIDLLRAASVLMRAGAQEIGLPPSGNISYPRWTSDPTFAYTDQDTTTDLSRTQGGTGVVRLQAKSLRGAVGIPNDLLRFSSPSAEQVIRMALAAKAALVSDNAGLEGVGTSVAPKGLITYTQSTAETPTANRLTLHVAQTVGADGNTLEPEDIALIQGLYEEGNDPDPATAWIMRPMLWRVISNKRADAVTAGDRKGPFLFAVDRGMMGNDIATRLGGVPVYSTTQLSKNRSKGASSTLHCLIYGNFRRQIHGLVGVIEIAASEHVLFLQDKTVIRAILRDDYGVEHEESFVFTDTLVQA